MIFILVEPGRTPLFGGLKVSVLATCRLCFMYNSAKVGKCQLVKWITYITFDGTDENDRALWAVFHEIKSNKI